MTGASASIVCNILSSIIYDVCKIGLGIIREKAKLTKQALEKDIKKRFMDEYKDLLMSGSFERFIESPFFKDTIENYMVYKIQGNYSKFASFDRYTFGSLFEKKNTTGITEDEVMDYLVGVLFSDYYKDTITVPRKDRVRRFLDSYFAYAVNIIIANLDSREKDLLFLMNRRLDYSFGSIERQIVDLEELIQKTIKCDIAVTENDYTEILNEYHRILKNKNSKAHIYLLDMFDFKKFYVPPFLHKTKPRSARVMESSMNVSVDDFLIPYISFGNDEKELADNDSRFDDWKYIFESSNLIYVTGGAGYGKSLFLKKIINDYDKLKMLNASEYLVIYGDLKSFYLEDGSKLSMVEYLQNCMKNETLLDDKKISVDLIEYYIKIGRCIVLLDALDEVEKSKREELHNSIIAYFREQNPNNKICITSRDRALIPANDVLLYEIQPLNRVQIEKYVDNIISLKRFDKKDKKIFLEQSDNMLDKGFLNSFLVLSLLINIYKAERELPENKLDLYQKCFEYIAYRREIEKSKTSFDWKLISTMIKENTFIELAEMCFPNNKEIGKTEIEKMLCDTYSKKYTCEAETENAAEQFLVFCSDRTELFVPGSGEDKFKFFHRSFFEFFYSHFIFNRVMDVAEDYRKFEEFDIDSEVFELTMAIFKKKDEPRYQALMDYIFKNVEDEFYKTKSVVLNAFNILTLVMQVVDDNEYLEKYFSLISDNKELFVDNLKYLPNQNIITELIKNNPRNSEKVILAYYRIARFIVVKSFFMDLYQVRRLVKRKLGTETKEDTRIRIESMDFDPNYRNTFFGNILDKKKELESLTKNEMDMLMNEFESDNHISRILKKEYKKFSELSIDKQNHIVDVLCDESKPSRSDRARRAIVIKDYLK